MKATNIELNTVSRRSSLWKISTFFAVTSCLLLCKPQTTCATDGAYAVSAMDVSVSFQWINDDHSGGVPKKLRVNVDANYRAFCGGPLPLCNPPPAQWQLILYDCAKLQIKSWMRSYLPGCGDSGSDQMKVKISICGRLPTYYRLKKYSGMVFRSSGGGGCEGNPSWTDPGFSLISMPAVGCANQVAYDGDWDAFRNDLKCLTCSGGSKAIPDRSAVPPYEGFKFYKTDYTIYTQPDCERTCEAGDARYGELVDGVFVPAQDGFLLLKTTDSSGGFVEVVGEADGQGCQGLSAGSSYDFQVRSGKGNPKGNFKMNLDWFWWERHPTWGQECCLRRTYRVLDLNVESMCPNTVDPVVPDRARITRGPGEAADIVATEVRIPACGTEQCPEGNLTPWFVVWPTPEGQKISDGHAKGWKIVGNQLFPPGEDTEGYEFPN